MIGAVEEHVTLMSRHRVAREHTALERLRNALLHGRNEFFRNDAANDLVFELVALAGSWLDADFTCPYWPLPPVCFMCV